MGMHVLLRYCVAVQSGLLDTSLCLLAGDGPGAAMQGCHDAAAVATCCGNSRVAIIHMVRACRRPEGIGRLLLVPLLAGTDLVVPGGAPGVLPLM